MSDTRTMTRTDFLLAALAICALTVLNVALIGADATSLPWIPVQVLATAATLGMVVRAYR